MDGLYSFSAEEWALLGDTPLAAGAVVALASEGGGLHEANAMVTGWREAAAQFGRSALVAEVAARMDPEAREEEGGDRSFGPPPSYDALLNEALDMCERAVDLLAARAAPDDVADYRGFVMAIAEKVARANSESGLLGVGGPAVSPDERSALRMIARALGYGR
ncbi:MAG: hypothetical protein OHK0015_17110 [Chloroflexi bacterium OHK40]